MAAHSFKLFLRWSKDSFRLFCGRRISFECRCILVFPRRWYRKHCNISVHFDRFCSIQKTTNPWITFLPFTFLLIFLLPLLYSDSLLLQKYSNVMTAEMIQLLIILGLATLNIFGAWYLNRLWSGKNSQRKENSSFGRSHWQALLIFCMLDSMQ